MSTPRGAKLGPKRAVVSREFDPSTGAIVKEILSCGHVHEPAKLKPWLLDRHCKTCLGVQLAPPPTEKCATLVLPLREHRARECGRPATEFERGKWRCYRHAIRARGRA